MDQDNNISPMHTGKGNTGKLSEDTLLAYLEGRLKPEEQHEVEQWLADEGMENDALEGLAEMRVMERRQSITKLNNGLRKKLAKKARKRRKARPDSQILIAVFVVLLLAVAAYMVIRYAR